LYCFQDILRFAWKLQISPTSWLFSVPIGGDGIGILLTSWRQKPRQRPHSWLHTVFSRTPDCDGLTSCCSVYYARCVQQITLIHIHKRINMSYVCQGIGFQHVSDSWRSRSVNVSQCLIWCPLLLNVTTARWRMLTILLNKTEYVTNNVSINDKSQLEQPRQPTVWARGSDPVDRCLIADQSQSF